MLQAAPILFVVCILYASLVYGLRWVWPRHHLTPFLVVGGNTIVCGMFGAIHGQSLAVDLFLLNIAAGLPMIVGYYIWFLMVEWKRNRQEKDI